MITQLLNNLRIRNKLIFLYIFCVFVPVVVTNAVIISLINKQAEEKQMQDLKKQLEMAEYDISGLLNNGVTATKSAYVDWSLYDFLNQSYETPLQYYIAYQKLMRSNSLRYYYSAQNIYDITIYSDNDTIQNGGNLAKLSTQKQTDWYRTFHESNNDIVVYVYFDEAKKYIQQDYARRVSVVRKLDYYDKNGIEKLVKVDFNYNEVQRQLLISQMKETVYVCNQDYIIFSNQEQNVGHKPFTQVSELNLNKASMKRSMEVFNETWTIYAFVEDVTLTNSMEGMFSIQLLLILVNLLLPTAIILLLNRSFQTRIELTEKYLKKVKHGEYENIECIPGKDEIGGLIHNYNTMVTKIKELIHVVYKEKMEKQELELSKKEAELVALHSQINPHFLFNTLESIRMRALLKDEKETSEVIGQLSIMMRKSLQWGEDLITIQEEMEFVQAYLFLQKYRFGDKLAFQFNVSTECNQMKIPKLTIVTFVENSCVHGMEGSAEAVEVEITVSKDTQNLYIEITDNGIGMKEESLKQLRKRMTLGSVEQLNRKRGIGILNASIRLRHYTDGRAQFEIDSSYETGTQVNLKIPLSYVIVSGKTIEGENHDSSIISR